MDLEVVGRHAMLFDDDGMAAFVNSAEALVEWNSLSIDRYDVRHLLSGPLPPRLKRRPPQPEPDLDHQRYLDLPSSSDKQLQDNDSDPVSSAGYHSVAFSYGNSNVSTETTDNETESSFRPNFPVPESLLHNLPPNEKVHQIISRTAMFVRKHGSQSEIILRVKHGDNPTFGFLMPDHRLHAYFRFLVDHQELLQVDKDDGSSTEDMNRTQGIDQTGGALSLLGSVYGSGEDEDGTTENTRYFEKKTCEGAVDAVSTYASPGIELVQSYSDVAKKDGSISKNPIPSLKEKVPVIKRNHSISTVKTATTARAKTGDGLDSVSNAQNKSQTSVPSTAKIELPVVEPPSDLKRAIEKIVEFILKNGKQFEAVLAEQDRPHGRFPFLLPSNRYHTYYLKVLKTAEESKLPGKGHQKHNPAGRAGESNTAVHEESDNLSHGSMASDLPYDMDQKEKFKMIIGKKKDGQDPISKDQAQNTVSMDAAATAAILQAATRGIKNPNLEFFTKTSSGSGQGLGSDGGYLSSSGSLYSSQPQGFVENRNLNAKASASAPVAKAIAEKVAIAAAGEADSSEAHMTKEQKLKAERLKRAKMFAAMLKSGVGAVKSELPRALSVEPPSSGLSGSDAEIGNPVGKEREGSSVPFDVDNSDKSQKSEEKLSVDNSDRSQKSEEKLTAENNELRSKRKYRSRSSRHEEEEEEEEEEENNEDKRDQKRSRKKHRASHNSRDRHKHKRRHSSSKDKYSYRESKNDSSSDDEHQRSRHRHKFNSSSDEKHHSSRRDRENSLSDHEHRHSRHSRHSNKHYSSSDDEHRHRSRSVKHHKSRSHAERETDPEEGEIIMKSERSVVSDVGRASREASAGLSNARVPSQSPEITDVSDELRAKIRAMLMAN
ncbi:Protein suppressor of white apricot, partial [Mucuna pruriens]